MLCFKSTYERQHFHWLMLKATANHRKWNPDTFTYRLILSCAITIDPQSATCTKSLGCLCLVKVTDSIPDLPKWCLTLTSLHRRPPLPTPAPPFIAPTKYLFSVTLQREKWSHFGNNCKEILENMKIFLKNPSKKVFTFVKWRLQVVQGCKLWKDQTTCYWFSPTSTHILVSCLWVYGYWRFQWKVSRNLLGSPDGNTTTQCIH